MSKREALAKWLYRTFDPSDCLWEDATEALRSEYLRKADAALRFQEAFNG